MDKDKKSGGINPSEYLKQLYDKDKQLQNLSGLEKLIEDIENVEKSHEASQDILLSDMNRKLPKERLAIRREIFCWGRYKSIPTALTLI